MPPIDGDQLYSTGPLDHTHVHVDKKLYNWLRDLFHDPPYLYDLYQLLLEEQAQTRHRPALSPRKQQGQAPPSSQDPPSGDSSGTSWIYYPKGEGGNTLSEWLSGNSGSGGAGGGDNGQAATQACDNISGTVPLPGTAALQAPLAPTGVGNCTAQFLVVVAQNGTATSGSGDETNTYTRGGVGEGGLPHNHGNFTFYDYGANGWPESQLQQIYDIIRHSQWNSNIILTALLALIFLVGISGNLLVLTVFARSKVRQASTLFIMALAATDLIICLVILPGVLLKEWAVPFRSDAVCKMWEWLRCTTIPLSSLILVAVAIDRYMLIGRAAVTRPLSNRAAKAILLLAVLVSAGMALPPSLGVGVYQRNSEPDYTEYGDYYGNYYEDYYSGTASSLPPLDSTSVSPLLATPASLSPLALHVDPHNLSDSGAIEAASLSTQANPDNRTLFSGSHFHGNSTLAQTSPNKQITWPSSTLSGSSLSPLSQSAGLSVSPSENPFQGNTSSNSSRPSSDRAPRTRASASPQPSPSVPSLISTTASDVKTTTTAQSSSDPPFRTTATPLGIKTTPLVTKTSTTGKETTLPGEKTSSPPSEFYLGLCWQNDILVNAAFTVHYWQAVAVLFLLVLINVLVMYGLVFRAVYRQSRRWGKPRVSNPKKITPNVREARPAGDNLPCHSGDSAAVFTTQSAEKARGSVRNMSKQGVSKDVCQEQQSETFLTGAKSCKSGNDKRGKPCSEESKAKPGPSYKHGTVDGRGEIGKNGEEDVTSLDDGHYNDWVTKPSVNSQTPQVQVDKTSIFCTGSCTVGRTKQYQRQSVGNAYQMNSAASQGYHKDVDSSTSVVISTTKVLYNSTEVERPYRRPSWIKRKLMRALLKHRTGWHQQHRQVHETAVFKLARRQRAKVKMLSKEYNTGDRESNDQNKTELSSEKESGSRESICEQFDTAFIQEEKTTQIKTALPTPSRGETSDKTCEIIINTQETSHREHTSLDIFPLTGEELQSQINNLASVSAYLPIKTGGSIKDRQGFNIKPESSTNFDVQGQLPLKNELELSAAEQKEEKQNTRSLTISSPFDSGVKVNEPSTTTYAGFSLPNTPDLSENSEDHLAFESCGKHPNSRKSLSSHDILRTIIQRQMHRRARPHSASDTTSPSKVQQKQPQLFNQLSSPSNLSKNLPYQANDVSTEPTKKEAKNKPGHSREDKTDKSHQNGANNTCQAPGKGQEKLAAHAASSHRRRYSTVQVKTAKILLLVTAVYLVSFAPALLMTLDLVPPHRIIFYAYFVHSAANPLIYSFINQNFRKQLAGLFKRKKRR